jgi:hypothetical protein
VLVAVLQRVRGARFVTEPRELAVSSEVNITSISSEILCHLFVSHTILDDGDDNTIETELDGYHCRLEPDDEREEDSAWLLRSINLPQSFIAEFREYAENNNPVLRISNVVVNEYDVQLLGGSIITIERPSSHHRRLAPKSGTPSLLSVYVTSSYGHWPDNSVEDIQNGIFGTGPNPAEFNTLRQYEDCSYGALQIQPASHGNNVNGGVVWVQVNRPLDSTCDLSTGSCNDEIHAATLQALGRSLSDYDMVMFCVPTGVLSEGYSDWAAYAFIGYRMSYFSRGYCNIMTTVGHELGHLMGYGQ